MKKYITMIRKQYYTCANDNRHYWWREETPTIWTSDNIAKVKRMALRSVK